MRASRHRDSFGRARLAILAILAILQSPFTFGSDQEVFLTASIGAASWHGDEAPRDLVRFAHTAMPQAKRSGPSGVRMFSGDMAIVSASRLEAETALRRVLERKELVAYYQAIVDLASGATIGVETLVRWNHPTRGVVPPGEWMLHQAMRDCVTWQSSAPGIGVSINVSAHQFRTGDLVGTVRAVVALAGVHGIRVVAEGIETESARALVQSAGCGRGQGYLFGRPGPLSDILPTLRARAFDAAGTSVPRA